MEYTGFEFANFRGISATKLALPSRSDGGLPIVTLVGLNESGKTTILEAIDAFDPVGTEDEVSPRTVVGWEKRDPHDLIPIAKRSNFNDSIRVRATVRLDESDQLAIKKHVQAVTGFRLLTLPDQFQITNTFAFKDSRMVNGQTSWPSVLGDGYMRTGRVLRRASAVGNKQVWLEVVAAVRDRLPIIWYFPNFLFEFPERIQLAAIDGESDSDRFYRALFADILNSLNKGLSVQTHVVERARSADPRDRRNLNQVLLEVGRSVTQTVVSAWSQIFENSDLEAKRVRVTVDTDAAVLASDGQPSVMATFSLEDGDGEYAISERSLGFRWFFVYMLLTNFRASRSSTRNTVFLLDEPASNLHPSAQAALLTSLARLAEGASVVYTTHTHHLINPSWLANTHVVVNGAINPLEIDSRITARQTDISVIRLGHFIAQHPDRKFYFQPVLDALQYAPSQLELVPAVVMLEGKSDYFVFRYVSEVLELGLDLPFSFLPGTGASSLDVLIQLYSGWGRPFAVLLDNDSEGKRSRERYIEKFGSLVKDRIMGLKNATGDIKAVESMFNEEDRLKIVQSVTPEVVHPTKSHFSSAIEVLLAEKRAVALSPDSEGNFRSVLAACVDLMQPQL